MVFVRQLAQATLSSHRLSVAHFYKTNTRLQRQRNEMKKIPYIPTAEEQALAEARKRHRQEKKEREAKEGNAQTGAPANTLLSRPWLTFKNESTEGSALRRVTILTWNLLAQCLIRRELFPTSDCLKVAQRESIIHEEILRQNADILCLQEVDRLEKLYPMLDKAGYSYHYASGPRKLHGCLIAFKRDLFSLASQRVIFYDEHMIGVAQRGAGASFRTKNIANLVALKRKGYEDEGLIVVTTHLFWHPRYTYERIRQVGIMIREAASFKEEINANEWPIVMAGDFNFDPSDPAYSLMRGDPLLTTQEDKITPSMVIHSSIDPSVLKSSSTPKSKGDDEEEDVDPDRHITNARSPTPHDGLLSVAEIIKWFSQLPKFRSLYDDGLAKAQVRGTDIPTYGQRVSVQAERHGKYEPEYTSFTHYWQSVLDYIFVAETPDCSVNVIGLLAPLTGEDMRPGLPQKRVSGSDHTCLMVELTW